MSEYKSNKSKLLGKISILLCASLWGIISFFTLPLQEKFGFNSFEITFFRLFMSTVFLGVYILIKDRSLFKINVKDLLLLVIIGLCFLSLCVTYTLSIEKNGSAVAAMLQYTSPIWTLIASFFVFKEKITLQKIIGLIGIVCGCVMLTLGGEINIAFLGILIGLLEAFLLATYNILCKIGSMKYRPETVTFYIFVFSVIFGFFVSKGWNVPPKLIENPKSLLYFAGLSLFSTVFAYIAYSFGLKRVSAGKASMLSSFELIVATLVGLFAFNVYPGVLGFVGIAVTVISLIFMEIKAKKRHKE